MEPFDCANCGSPMTHDDNFCSACGTPVKRTATDPSDSGHVIGAPGHGPNDQWSGFSLSATPDPVAGDAADIVERQLTNLGVRSESNSIRHCRIHFQEYVGVSTDTAYAGSTRALIGATLTRAILGSGRPKNGIDKDASYYVFRVCTWGAVGDRDIGMSTYSASLWSRRLRRGFAGGVEGSKFETQTYPPSPLTNTIFAVLPGPCEGQYVISREAGVTPNQDRTHSPWLLEQLSDPGFTSHLDEVMARDFDVIGKDAFKREYLLPFENTKRPLGPERGTDPYFLPTLFENDPLNYRSWPGYLHEPTRRVKGFGSSLVRGIDKTAVTIRNFDPAKYFAVVLLPFRSSTLVVATLPTPSTFDQAGRLIGTDLGLEDFGRLIGYLSRVLDDPRSRESASVADLDYWSLANQVTVYPGSKTKQFNFAIPPLEWALTYSGSQ